MALQKALNHVHPGRNPLAFHLLLSVAFFLSFYLVSARFLIIMGRFCSPLLPSTGWVMMQDLHALVQQPPSPLSVVFLGFGAVVHSWHRLGPAKDAAWHHLWDAVRLEPSLSASSPQAGASITLHSARSWNEFSSVSSKTIPELRNPQPINPGKLCRPKVLKSAPMTCLLWLLICISCRFLRCYQGCGFLHLATSREEVVHLNQGPQEHSLNLQFPPGYESCAVPGRFSSTPQPRGKAPDMSPPVTTSPVCQHPAAHFVHLHVLYIST